MKVGTDEWLEEEFELLRKYNSFYVQVLQHCFEFGGGKFYLCEIPLYDEFKGNLDRFTKPSYKDSTYLNKSGEEVENWCKGLGAPDGIRFRMYLYFRGVKIYTNGNVLGKYSK